MVISIFGLPFVMAHAAIIVWEQFALVATANIVLIASLSWAAKINSDDN